MTKLRVYGLTVFRHNHRYATIHGEVRAIVAARNQKEAAVLLDVKVHMLASHGSITGNQYEVKLALANPKKVFIGPLHAKAEYDADVYTA